MAFKYKVQQGDTLNKISNRFGFRNFRDAGVRSVKSGNFDKIGIGEEITLENYDPNKVQTSPSSTPPVISSLDNARQVNDDTEFVKNRLGVNVDQTQEDVQVKDKVEETPVKVDKPEAPKEINGITDPTYVKSRQDDEAKRNEASIKMQEKKDELMTSIDTRLARNDERLQSKLTSISQIWDKRIKIQDRLNKLNDNRIKAYGLAGSAVYQPIQYTGEITLNEQNSADKIQELESFREQSLNEAKLAFEQGNSIILSDKRERIQELEAEIEKKYSDIEKESEKQYKLFKTIEKEQEARDKVAREKILNNLKAFVSLRKDEYANMTPEEIELKVAEVMKLTNVGYSEAFNAIMEGIQTNLKDEKLKSEIEKSALDIEKKKLDIKDRPDVKARKEAESKALIEQRKASAKASRALAEKRGEVDEKDKKVTIDEMNADIPDTFKDDDEAEQARQKFVKKYGQTGAKHWNAIFQDPDSKSFTYPEGKSSSSVVDDVQKKFRNLYNY